MYRIATSTFLGGQNDTTPLTTDSTWPEFVDYLRFCQTNLTPEIKSAAPLISGVHEGGKTKAHWKGTNWIGLDIDYSDEVELISWLASASFASVAYTTFSHTPEAPRFRVIIPFLGWVDNEPTYQRVWAAFYDLLQVNGRHLADSACKNINRGFYAPTLRPHSWLRDFEGPILTLEAILEVSPQPRGPSDALLAIQSGLLQQGAEQVTRRRRKKPGHASIFSSDIVKSVDLQAYYNREKTNNFHTGFHSCLCSIAARAANLGYPLTADQLALIAKQIDYNDVGGPYYSHREYDLKARDAYKFSFLPGPKAQ